MCVDGSGTGSWELCTGHVAPQAVKQGEAVRLPPKEQCGTESARQAEGRSLRMGPIAKTSHMMDFEFYSKFD